MAISFPGPGCSDFEEWVVLDHASAVIGGPSSWFRCGSSWAVLCPDLVNLGLDSETNAFAYRQENGVYGTYNTKAVEGTTLVYTGPKAAALRIDVTIQVCLVLSISGSNVFKMWTISLR